ncbi:MAG: Crp/Fnr family transcriptional regulator [Candidatus Paceibacterota bacterium]
MAKSFNREAGADQLKDFFEKYPSQSFKSGEVIYRPDEDIPFVYYLQEGYVSQQVVSENGEDFILNIYRPGSYLPISLVLQGIINDCSYETLTKVVTRRAPVKEVLHFLKKNPVVMQELLVRLASGLNAMASKTEALVFGTASRKIAATLYFNAQRFGKPATSAGKPAVKGQGVVIDFPLTHKRIAAMTGITRETASIEMAKLKKQGVLSYRGKQVTIFNLGKLYNTCFCQLPTEK